jgi:hypothetical protein
MVELTAGGRRMRAALAAVLVSGTALELALAHRWLDNWRGVGQIAEGMHRAGWDLQLTEYGEGAGAPRSTSLGRPTRSWVARRGRLPPGLPSSAWDVVRKAA